MLKQFEDEEKKMELQQNVTSAVQLCLFFSNWESEHVSSQSADIRGSAEDLQRSKVINHCVVY